MNKGQSNNNPSEQFVIRLLTTFEGGLDESVSSRGSHDRPCNPSHESDFGVVLFQQASPTSVCQERIIASMRELTVSKCSTSPIPTLSGDMYSVEPDSELLDIWSLPPQLVRVAQVDSYSNATCCPRPSDPVASFLNSQA